MKEKLIPIAATAILAFYPGEKTSPSKTYDRIGPAFTIDNTTYRLAIQNDNPNTYTVFLINALNPQGPALAAWQILDIDHDGPEATMRLTLDHQTQTGTLDPGSPDIINRILSPNPLPPLSKQPI